MSIKLRLTLLNFLELFAWGTWLLSAGAYMAVTLNFSGIQIGAVYATLGITSLIMPALMGIIADRWINAEKLFGICHLFLAALFVGLAQITNFASFYLVMFCISAFYMPTLALNNSISYAILEKEKFDIIKTFPPIRVWGTIGFIIAAWGVDLMGWKVSIEQFYFSAATSFILGLYAFSLPSVATVQTENQSLLQRLGLDAFVLLKDKQIAIFFFFSILLGAALQITNIWGVPFLSDFELNFKDSFAVKHAIALMTLSQISETLFILTIPFFLKKYGIKIVMLMSIIAWIFRFGLFGIGSPEGIGLFYLILSMIFYGMAFDFFGISGSLFIEQKVKPEIRSSAQGLFMMMASGFGPILGGYGSGIIVDYFTTDMGKNWSVIWLVFAAYALVIAVAFIFLFRYEHRPKGVIRV